MQEEKKSEAQVVQTVSILNIAICDDEAEFVQEFENMLLQMKVDRNWKITTFLSSKDLQEALRTGTYLPEVIFLDIEMPDIDGITLGKQIRDMDFGICVVFTTAHPEYAVSGYEAQAFRYLLKPLTEEMILKVLGDVSRELGKRKKLLLKSDGKEYLIPLKDILYICAEDKYTVVYTHKQHYVDRTGLKQYEEMLFPYGFYRTHRKYIVNISHHVSLEKGKICLTNQHLIPISRRREKEYCKELLGYLEKELV